MCECETCTEFSKLLKPCKFIKYQLNYIFILLLLFTDRDASAKHDFSCVILAKSEVNQLIVFVQAFMQRYVPKQK